MPLSSNPPIKISGETLRTMLTVGNRYAHLTSGDQKRFSVWPIGEAGILIEEISSETARARIRCSSVDALANDTPDDWN